jgi:hypothetical protein
MSLPQVVNLDYDLCNTTFYPMIDAHLDPNGGFEADKRIPLLECDETAMAVRDSQLTLEDMVIRHLQPENPGVCQPFSLLHTQMFHSCTFTDTLVHAEARLHLPVNLQLCDNAGDLAHTLPIHLYSSARYDPNTGEKRQRHQASLCRCVVNMRRYNIARQAHADEHITDVPLSRKF